MSGHRGDPSIQPAPAFGRVAWLPIIAVICVFALLQYRYALGGNYYYHDSVAAATNMYLFYDRLFAGHSWLWTSSLNAGQPLWPVVETMPVMDPLALGVWWTSHLFSSNALVAFQLTCIVWLMAFALGGYLCARLYARTHWGPALVLLLLLAGPIALSTPAQSYGFLIPFRYFPFFIYFYLAFLRAPSRRAAVQLGCVFALSWAGYQSVLFAIAAAGFVVAHAAVLALRRDVGKLFRIELRHAMLPILIGTIGALPILAFAIELNRLVPIPRVYEAGIYYCVAARKLLGDMFAPFVELAGVSPTVTTWHGSFDIGLFPIVFAGLAAVAGVGRVLTGRDGTRPDIAEDGVSVPTADHALVWLLFTVLMMVLCTGGMGIRGILERHQTLLDLRNWGFLATPAVFGLVQMAGYGFDHFGSNAPFAGRRRWIFAGVLALAAMIGAYLAGTGSVARLWVAVAFPPVLGLLLLRAQAASRNGTRSLDFRPYIFIVVFAYALGLNHLHPSNYRAALKRVGYSDADAQLFYGGFVANIPRLSGGLPRFAQRRVWSADLSAKFPFQFEAPAVDHRPLAFLEARLPLGYHVAIPSVKITQQFRLDRYQALVTRYGDPADRGLLRSVLGVDSNIVRMVGAVLPSASRTDALRRLGKLWREGLLPSTAVVEGVRTGTPALAQLAVARPGSVAAGGPLRYTVRVEAFRPGRLTVAVTASRTGLLIYADNFTRDWRATVDGRASRILAANVVDKGVIVPAGTHRVEFFYEPRIYIVSFTLRALLYTGIVLTLLWRLTAAGVKRLRF